MTVDSGRITGNPEAEAALQLQRGLVLPNAVVLTVSFVNTWRLGRTYFPESPFLVSLRMADHPSRTAR